MAGAPNERSTKKTEIGLVLQGGGALGAYEWGGIQALFKLMKDAGDAGRDVTLRAVTGVSIGAINAACIVGADEDKGPLARLETLWNDFMIKAPAFVPAAVTLNLALLEVPRFYRFSPAWNWTSLYDTHELLKTLSDHVSFDALNKSDTTFVVTAVDVETADLMRFSNKKLGKLHRDHDQTGTYSRQWQLGTTVSLDENQPRIAEPLLLGWRARRQHAAR